MKLLAMRTFTRLKTLPPLSRLISEPEATLANAKERRDARLLASLLFGTLVLILIGHLLRIAAGGTLSGMSQVTSNFTLVSVIVCYSLSRTRHYRAGLTGAIIAISGVQFFQLIAQAYIMPSRIPNMTISLVITMLFASLLISWRATLLLCVINIAAMFSLLLFVPELRFINIVGGVSFLIFVMIFILLASVRRNNDIRRIEDSEKRFRTLLEASSEGLVLHDDGIVMDANESFLRMTGYTLEEIANKTVMNFVAPEDHEMVMRNIGVLHPYEIRMLRKDGTRMETEIQVKRVTYAGKLVRVIGLRDLTGFKQAQTERERASVLQQFIGDASHDLRNPLAIMMTSLHLLRRRTSHVEGASGNLDTLDEQVAHLTQLVEDMLTMSRLDASDTLEAHDWVDLTRLCEQLVQERQNEATNRHQRLRFEPALTNPKVKADEAGLYRALNTLMDNALAYTGENGEIVVRLLTTGHQEAVVEFEDTGIGIAPNVLPRIFDRFYRGDAARNLETGGTGLGLAIAKKIIYMHGGAINVESTLGVGSTFRVSLPVPPAVVEPVAYALAAH